MTRSVEEIGAGLAPSRRGLPFPRGMRLHVMGIGGTAALGAALHARALGIDVSGCDHALSEETAGMLISAGVSIVSAAAAEHPRNATHLAVSKAITSVTPDHPELTAARAAGVPLLSVQQVIADAAATRGGPLVGVAGTHGKTTSTGWLLAALRASGHDFSAFVGGPLGAEDGTPPGSPVHFGASSGFVVEADEYGGNFDPYAADAALILNADWDHPDIFADLDAVVRTFVAWGGAILSRGPLVLNVGDRGGASIARMLHETATAAERRNILTYAVRAAGTSRAQPPVPSSAEGGDATGDDANAAGAENADVSADIKEMGDGSVDLEHLRLSPSAEAALPELALLAQRKGTLTISLLGAHNAANALGVAVLAAAVGGTAQGIATALSTFPGVGRRLEVLFDDGERTVLDDYGHHPTAIIATIATVRKRYPGRRLILAIEPLTYHRTAALLEPLAAAAAAADEVVVADIFAVRDTDLQITSAAELASAVARKGVSATAPGSAEAAADAIASAIPQHAVVLVMGGGRSTVLAARLAAALRATS